MSSLVCIVVLNWNGHEDTLQCLRSVQQLEGEPCQLVVVDNGSTDNSVAMIRSAFPQVSLIENKTNLGYAEGNNVGIRHAMAQGAQFILVLNNDTVCAPDLIRQLLAAAARHPRAGFLCPRMFYMADPTRVWFDGAVWNSSALRFDSPGQDALGETLGDADHETAYACGAALFVRAELVREIGAFDARFFLVWEESDWCYRARKSGWSSWVAPQARIWHRVGASFGTEASPLRTYFSYRNRLVWLQRHGTLFERMRATAQAVRSTVPPWTFTTDTAVPMVRRVAWALRDWQTAVRGRGRAIQFLAKRRAALDYLTGRLGPPPSVILELNRQWLHSRQA